MEPGLKSLPNLETLVLSNNCISNLCYFKASTITYSAIILLCNFKSLIYPFIDKNSIIHIFPSTSLLYARQANKVEEVDNT